MYKVYHNTNSRNLINTGLYVVKNIPLERYIKTNAKVRVIEEIIFLEPLTGFAEIEYLPEKLLLNTTNITDFSDIFAVAIASWKNTRDFKNYVLLPFEFIVFRENSHILGEKGQNIKINVSNEDIFVSAHNYFPLPVICVRQNNLEIAGKCVNMPVIKYNTYKFEKLNGEIDILWRS